MNHTVVKEVVYDSFGNITEDSNESFKIPLGFAGGLQDRETGLVHFGYREYDPFTGRWTAKDPIGFNGGDSNLYGYVLNDPVNLVDPWGLDWVYNTNSGMLIQVDGSGNAINRWPAVSGPWGKGQLPKGEYTLSSPPVLVPPSHPKQSAYCDSVGNCWWQPIEPNFQTGRTELGIHPDGNVPGTAGCIGASDKDTTSLLDALRNDQGTLTVR